MNIATKIEMAEIGKSMNHVGEIYKVPISAETITIAITELITTVIKRCDRTLYLCVLANIVRIIEPIRNKGKLKNMNKSRPVCLSKSSAPINKVIKVLTKVSTTK